MNPSKCQSDTWPSTRKEGGTNASREHAVRASYTKGVNKNLSYTLVAVRARRLEDVLL